MFSDPICLLIGGSMALLIGWSALRAMRTTFQVRQTSDRLAREVGVAKIAGCETVGEPAAGEVLVRISVQLPYPAGSTTDVQVVRSVAPAAWPSSPPARW